MRPIGGKSNVAVLDRIEMDVIEMAVQIVLVPDQMFPIASLPNPTFTLPDPRPTPVLITCNVPRKPGLDLRPAHGKVIIPGRQGPQAMQVFEEYDDGVELERSRTARRHERSTQGVDVLDQHCRATFGQVDREKIGASGGPMAKIVRHDHNIRHPRRSRHQPNHIVAIGFPRNVGWASAHHCHPSALFVRKRWAEAHPTGYGLMAPRRAGGRVVGSHTPDGWIRGQTITPVPFYWSGDALGGGLRVP